MENVIGYIHSVESFGALDGPGVRYVLFLQGCPLRCLFCHNPDSWAVGRGQPIGSADVVRDILRYRHFIEKGGVTLSGGEPLMQPEFAASILEGCRENGLHTALDTSGTGCSTAAAERVLRHTDLVLCDLKFLTAADYRRYCRAELAQVERFLQLTAMKGVPLWIRHVVVPGLTDSLEHLRLVKAHAERYPNLQKIEYLPFHKLCIEKYDRMGIDFPLRDTPAMNEAWLKQLLEKL